MGYRPILLLKMRFEAVFKVVLCCVTVWPCTAFVVLARALLQRVPHAKRTCVTARCKGSKKRD